MFLSLWFFYLVCVWTLHGKNCNKTYLWKNSEREGNFHVGTQKPGKSGGGGKRRLRYSKIIVQLKIKCSKDWTQSWIKERNVCICSVAVLKRMKNGGIIKIKNEHELKDRQRRRGKKINIDPGSYHWHKKNRWQWVHTHEYFRSSYSLSSKKILTMKKIGVGCCYDAMWNKLYFRAASFS